MYCSRINEICFFRILLFVGEAATKIQAVYRGHRVRASMKKADSSSKDAVEQPKSAASSEAVGDDCPSKEELEAEFREDDKGALYYNIFYFL